MFIFVLFIFQQQFVEELLTTGLLVYLSPAWLSEVYQHVIKNNFLAEAGYDFKRRRDPEEEMEQPLIQVLTGIYENEIYLFHKP